MKEQDPKLLEKTPKQELGEVRESQVSFPNILCKNARSMGVKV
jgi:hypothetical protein